MSLARVRSRLSCALAVLALALSGCESTGGHPPLHPVSFSPPLYDEVLVCVSVVNGEIRVSPDPVQIYVDKQVVHWFTCDGTLEIKMTKDSPFAANPEHAGKHVRSGKALKGSQGDGIKRYPYSIKLTPPRGEPITKDPDIEVMG